MKPLDRRIFALAIPALGALAADPLLSLVDTFFVSRLGPTALAALAVNGAVFGFAFVVFNFLAYVTTPMVARAQGAGDSRRSRQIISSALLLGLVLGVVAAAVLIGFARPLLLLVQTGPEVMDPALSYLRIRALAAPAVLVTLAGHGAFRGMADTRTPLVVAVGVNVLNAVLAPLLIFGLGMGVTGAAVASVIAQYLGAALLLGLLWRRLGGLAGGGLTGLANLLRPGALITTRTLLLVTTMAATTSVASRIGTESLAAHQIVRETWFLSAMLIDGLAIAAQTLVAEASGRADRQGEIDVIKRLFWWGGWVGLAMTGLWLVSGSPLTSVFAPTAGVASEVMRVTPVLALFAFPAAWLWVADGVVLGQLRLTRMVASTGTGMVAAALVLLLTVRNDWGLPGVWWAIGLMVVARLLVLIPGLFPSFEQQPPGLGKRQGEESRH